MGLHHQGDIEFSGEENIGTYKSSEWAERSFCKVCGTNLFWRMRDDYSFGVGLFDDQNDFELSVQYYIDEKPAHYSFANKTKTLTGQELLELFADQDD